MFVPSVLYCLLTNMQKQINGKGMNLHLNLKLCKNKLETDDLNIKCEAIKLSKHRGKPWRSRVLKT